MSSVLVRLQLNSAHKMTKSMVAFVTREVIKELVHYQILDTNDIEKRNGRTEKSTWTCAAEFYMNKSIHCVLLLKISRERPSGELETREHELWLVLVMQQRPNRRSCLAARFRGSGALHERRRRRGAIGAPAEELLGGRQ
jgi:hypothetical protein